MSVTIQVAYRKTRFEFFFKIQFLNLKKAHKFLLFLIKSIFLQPMIASVNASEILFWSPCIIIIKCNCKIICFTLSLSFLFSHRIPLKKLPKNYLSSKELFKEKSFLYFLTIQVFIFLFCCS